MSGNLAGQGALLALILGGLYVGYSLIPEKYFTVKSEAVNEERPG